MRPVYLEGGGGVPNTTGPSFGVAGSPPFSLQSSQAPATKPPKLPSFSAPVLGGPGSAQKGLRN